jgi:hypothetical protein
VIVLAWYLEQPTPVRRYAAALLTESLGLSAQFLDRPPGAGPYLHHGRGTGVGRGAVLIPAEDGAEPPLDVALVAAEGPPPRFSGDLLAGAIAFVTDAVHAGIEPGALDRHGRLRSAESHLARRTGITDPVVNRYALTLASALPMLGLPTARPPWPRGARAAIGLSHDVDRPDKYAILRAVRDRRVPPPRRLPWYAARAARDFSHWLRDVNRNDFWLFDEVVDAEAARGFRSTFLFSVVPAYASYGSTNDVLYDASWPHLRAAMRKLRAAGIELGLHASYHAHRLPERFVEERERLEDLSEGPIRGLRHHFWQMGPDVAATLRAHETAGFTYDSSIAFNDAVGLRRAIGLPYRPWDERLGRPLGTWQLPVIALDSAACAGIASVTEGIDRVWEGIERVADAGGVAVLDWHVRCSYPGNDRYRTWGQVYLGLLDRLAAADDLWVAGLGEIAEWAATGRARPAVTDAAAAEG